MKPDWRKKERTLNRLAFVLGYGTVLAAVFGLGALLLATA